MGNLLRESILRGSHKRETSREQINSQDRKLIDDKRRADRRREVEVVLQRQQQAQQMQEEAIEEVRDMKIRALAMLEEEGRGIISTANFGLNM